MARSCICFTVITILSMFSLVVCKPFLGDLLARAIASSSSPDDPQSHISDFRNMTKMDTKAEKLQNVAANGGSSSNETVESLSDVELPETRPPSFIMSLPASSLWQSWNRTKILSRIVDDIVKPVHERISLVFQTLVARTGPKDSAGDMAHGNSKLEDLEKLLANSTDDNDSEELVAELDLLHPESEPTLIDPSMNGSTLLGQFQVRRNILRRRVAKALSSITGLLILAANSRRESKPRTRRSLESSTESEALLGDRPDFLDVPNEIDTDSDDDPKVTALLETEDKLDQPASEVTPRRNFETVGIFILEVFGSIAGFSWGIFKQVQSLFG
uniref:Transmembrane protein n=1 Tax=Anopheles atroparvus TaxID=41427 RepID=A0AAG5CT58_ANOAO